MLEWIQGLKRDWFTKLFPAQKFKNNTKALNYTWHAKLLINSSFGLLIVVVGMRNAKLKLKSKMSANFWLISAFFNEIQHTQIWPTNLCVKQIQVASSSHKSATHKRHRVGWRKKHTTTKHDIKFAKKALSVLDLFLACLSVPTTTV